MDSINKTIEDSFMETIISMSRNRYNYRNHRTMIKYKIDCKKMKECLDKDNNIHFLYCNRMQYNFLSKLDKDSPEYKKFISLLDKNEFLCIKVGNDKLKSEYNISESLKQLNIPVFMNMHCILECNDNLCIDNKIKFLDVKRNIIYGYGYEYESNDNIYSKSFPDEINVPVNILVMPYIEYGEIGLHIWSRETFHILKNCLKHIVMSLLYSAYKIDFIHNCNYDDYRCGLHEGNLLLGKTDLQKISYGEFGELEIIDGYIPVINDYHTGGFIDYGSHNNMNIPNIPKYEKQHIENNFEWMIYEDIRHIINCITIRSECKIDTDNCNFISNIKNLYKYENYSKGITITSISKNVCDALCSEIDNITIYHDVNGIV